MSMRNPADAILCLYEELFDSAVDINQENIRQALLLLAKRHDCDYETVKLEEATEDDCNVIHEYKLRSFKQKVNNTFFEACNELSNTFWKNL